MQEKKKKQEISVFFINMLKITKLNKLLLLQSGEIRRLGLKFMHLRQRKYNLCQFITLIWFCLSHRKSLNYQGFLFFWVKRINLKAHTEMPLGMFVFNSTVKNIFKFDLKESILWRGIFYMEIKECYKYLAFCWCIQNTNFLLAVILRQLSRIY